MEEKHEEEQRGDARDRSTSQARSGSLKSKTRGGKKSNLVRKNHQRQTKRLPPYHMEEID